MTLPDAALQQHIAILGKSGSGKTTCAKALIVEPLLAAGKRVAVVDPTSAWWGLRSSADGKGPGFKVLVLGGDHGDLPLPALGGAAVARLVVEQGVNLVADTGNLTVGERTRWMIDFAGTLYRLNRAPLHLVLDEAHVFAPQSGGGRGDKDVDANKMLHAVNQIAAGGRSRGIRLTMLTQRPQKLAKDTLTTADTLIAMRVLAPQDREAVKAWVDGCGDVAQGKMVLDSLAQLQRGEGWVWYPEGGLLERRKFPAIRTFDSSATPKDGDTLAAPKGAAEIDLAEIRAALADAVKEAEANDPKVLRARIAELQRAAAKPAPAADPHAIDNARRAGYQTGVVEGREQTLRALGSYFDRLQTLATSIGEHVAGGIDDLARELRKQQAGDAPKPLQRVAENAPTPPRATPAQRQAAPAPRTNGAHPPASAGGDVTRPQQRLLETLAMLESIGIAHPSKTQLALWADVSPTSGGYFNNLGVLRSAGLIEYPSGGTAALTDAGRERAPTPAPMTETEMHEALCAKVGASKAAIVRALIQIYPRDIAKDALAGKIGVSPTSGGYFNNLGALRTLGVLDYPAPGRVVAQPVLFLQA